MTGYRRIVILGKIRHKLVKTKLRRRLYITNCNCIMNKNKGILANPTDIITRWKQYVKHLLNIPLEDLPPVLGPIQPFTIDYLCTQMKKMQNKKACVPDRVPVEYK